MERKTGRHIRRDPKIALSWPPHVQVGDKLPCFDCHNVHGSEGNDRTRPNARLISDQRIEKVTDELKEGDEVLVKVLEIDRQGKIRLSRKEAMKEQTKAGMK